MRFCRILRKNLRKYLFSRNFSPKFVKDRSKCTKRLKKWMLQKLNYFLDNGKSLVICGEKICNWTIFAKIKIFGIRNLAFWLKCNRHFRFNPTYVCGAVKFIKYLNVSQKASTSSAGFQRSQTISQVPVINIPGEQHRK